MVKKFFKLLLLLVIGLAAIAVAKFVYRPGMTEYEAAIPSADAQQAVISASNQEPLRITWLGVTTLIVDDGSTRLMFDPYVSRGYGWLHLLLNKEIESGPTVVDAWLKHLGIDSIDAMLVGHSHFDHILDVASFGKASGAKLYGSDTSRQIAIGHGLPAEQAVVAELGKPFQVGRFRVTFLPSQHAGFTGGRPTGTLQTPLSTPAKYIDYKLGEAYAILLEHPQGNLLYLGSAGYDADVLKAVRADAVLLGIAATPPWQRYFKDVVTATGANTVFPVHWDDFTRSLAKPLKPLPFAVDLSGFYSAAEQYLPTVDVISLPLGTPIAWRASYLMERDRTGGQ